MEILLIKLSVFIVSVFLLKIFFRTGKKSLYLLLAYPAICYFINVIEFLVFAMVAWGGIKICMLYNKDLILYVLIFLNFFYILWWILSLDISRYFMINSYNEKVDVVNKKNSNLKIILSQYQSQFKVKLFLLDYGFKLALKPVNYLIKSKIMDCVLMCFDGGIMVVPIKIFLGKIINSLIYSLNNSENIKKYLNQINEVADNTYFKNLYFLQTLGEENFIEKIKSKFKNKDQKEFEYKIREMSNKIYDDLQIIISLEKIFNLEKFRFFMSVIIVLIISYFVKSHILFDQENKLIFKENSLDQSNQNFETDIPSINMNLKLNNISKNSSSVNIKSQYLDNNHVVQNEANDILKNSLPINIEPPASGNDYLIQDETKKVDNNFKDTQLAKIYNKKGLESRKLGYNNEALKYYQDAVLYDPSYVPARYNLACEFALNGDKNIALQELDNLIKINTEESIWFVIHSAHDEDFILMWNDAELQKIWNQFSNNSQIGWVEEICQNENTIKNYIHPQKGFYYYNDLNGIKNNINNLQDLNSLIFEPTIWCKNNHYTYENGCHLYQSDIVLNQQKRNTVCLTRRGCDVHKFSETFCFFNYKSKWYISSFLKMKDQSWLEKNDIKKEEIKQKSKENGFKLFKK
jgi:hypothetical protein